MFNTLAKIGKSLNEFNVTWAVGASLMLNQYRLIDKPNDIDLIVVLADIHKADMILKSLGEKKKWEETSTYGTKYFYEYIIDGIDIDVMAGLAVNHDEGVFDYIFNDQSVSEFEQIGGINIPFTSLEDWYVLYQLMPNREPKVKMIEDYLISEGIGRKGLLERALGGNLPVEVRKRVEKIFELSDISG